MLNQSDAINLKLKTINIQTLKTAGNFNTGGKLYCGRHKSRNRDRFNPLDLGLGNPFSHKNTTNCMWQVDSLAKCLEGYRLWLWKLIQNVNSQNNLTDWERMYLYRFLNLVDNLEKYHTLVCFCADIQHNTENSYIVCHTQILWNAAVWFKINKRLA